MCIPYVQLESGVESNKCILSYAPDAQEKCNNGSLPGMSGYSSGKWCGRVAAKYDAPSFGNTTCISCNNGECTNWLTLPPKKKGRKKKGEIDTETEEEKQMRAEERQRKNRESAARSHRRKAELAGALEKRATDAEAKAERLEKEVAKLKAEIARLKRK